MSRAFLNSLLPLLGVLIGACITLLAQRFVRSSSRRRRFEDRAWSFRKEGYAAVIARVSAAYDLASWMLTRVDLSDDAYLASENFHRDAATIGQRLGEAAVITDANVLVFSHEFAAAFRVFHKFYQLDFSVEPMRPEACRKLCTSIEALLEKLRVIGREEVLHGRRVLA